MKYPHVLRLALSVPIACISALTAMAADPAPPANVASAVPNYQVAVSPANIAPTPATQSNGKPVDVVGQPTNITTHPCTLVDSDDIARYKELLKTNAAAQASLKNLQDFCDKRITQDPDVPIAQKAADGSWMFPGDFPPEVSPFAGNNPGSGLPGEQRLDRTQGYNSFSIAQLGMVYQLTGDQKYGEYCKKLLLAYADNYTKWGHIKGWTPKNLGSAYDGRLSFQFLNDGSELINFAYGYDMVHDLPSWTKEERDHVRDDFFKPVIAEFTDPVLGNVDYLSQDNNRSALCAAGVLITGYACEDDGLVNEALYGSRGGTKDNPTGGIVGIHFSEKGILPDGTWVEGAIGYQVGIASCALFDDAEVLWRHGMDMYRFRNGALKRLLDSSIALAYPDDKLTVPALHDSGSFGLLTDQGWLNNEIGDSYARGYVRYQDPHYLPIIRNAQQSFNLSLHNGPPSLFLDLPPADKDPVRAVESVNFYSVGYGVLRQVAPAGPTQLLLEYGICAGHSHPSKLGIDLYALGKAFMPFPGMVFPYDNPLQAKWYTTTLGNCDLTIDNQSQNYGGQYFLYPRDAPTPIADQLVFGPAATMGIQRAWSNTLYARPWADPTVWGRLMGAKEWPVPTTPFNQVEEDRSLFLAPAYMADIFGAFSMGPHQYDLAWHILGDMTTALKTEPYTFPDPVPNGYNTLENMAHASTDQPWTATVTTPNQQTVHFLAAGGTPTDIYIGNRIADPRYPKTPDKPPIFFQRRDNQNNVIWGNAVDISGTADGYLKSVKQEGSLDLGYGLLKLETIKGTDLCFTAYRPGSYTAGGLTTDAMQAMVRMDGANVKAMYLGGGTTLKSADGTIQRSEPGLAYVEKTADGSYIIGNPSPTKATVTVTLPGLGGVKKVDIDANGQWTNGATSAK